jgi:hypothetical protein
MARPQGTIRQSQLITTFGPGAMVDLPHLAGVPRFRAGVRLRERRGTGRATARSRRFTASDAGNAAATSGSRTRALS